MNWLKKYKIYIILLLSFSFLLLTFHVAVAQSPIWQDVSGGCRTEGDCSVCDMVQIAINVGIFLQGIVGSIILLFFVYGGLVWLTSGGDSGKVKKGRDIFINSIIGFMIVVLAYFVVMTLINVVTGEEWNWDTSLECSFAPSAEKVVILDQVNFNKDIY